LRDKFHPELLTGSPERGVKRGWGGKTGYFLAFKLYESISRKR